MAIASITPLLTQMRRNPMRNEPLDRFNSLFVLRILRQPDKSMYASSAEWF